MGEKYFNEIESYYSEKVTKYGATAKGVDWKDSESQHFRFKSLAYLLPSSGDFELNDIGCGYGAFIDFLELGFKNFSYKGYDISQKMIDEAQRLHGSRYSFFRINANSEIKEADYSVANGLFNLRFKHSEEDWKKFVLKSMDEFLDASRLGVASTFLSSYSDHEKRRSDLFYANPLEFYDYFMRKYSRKVTIISDYSLFEFTLVVRK